jgi:uncharacterized C2H2 Zn-finger protein
VCGSIHCFIHNVDEPGPGYLGCPECGHLFKTKRALRVAYRHAWRRATRDHLLLFAADTWRLSWWRYVWHMITLRVGKIYSCPVCTSDF